MILALLMQLRKGLPVILFNELLIYYEEIISMTLIFLGDIMTGPGCSSLGYGAMEEVGPFRVNADGKTLSRFKYAWNNGNT